MRAAFITTVWHNVGDDLVREGIRYLLEMKLGPINPLLVHKHFPATVRDEYEWMNGAPLRGIIDRWTGGRSRVISRLIDRLPLKMVSDKILRSDVLIQSGAPVYWCFPDGSGCHTNEWFHPLLERRYSLVRDRVPLLNIGAGSCQPYHSDGSEFMRNSECMTYIRKLSGLSMVTTVRDKLAQSVLRMAGFDAPLLACPSIFARDRLGVSRLPGEFVALNFMAAGGHYELGQRIDFIAWQQTFVAFCKALRRMVPVILVCHSRDELRLASTILPEVRRVLVDSVELCLSFYSRVFCYVGSRVHGALAAASFGHPAFVIGSDSRARTAEEISVSSGFVADMSVDRLMAEFERLKNETEHFAVRSAEVREGALARYMSEFEKINKWFPSANGIIEKRPV